MKQGDAISSCVFSPPARSLYTIKKVEDLSGTKPRPMKIVFGEGGKEEFEPIEERGAKAQVEALKVRGRGWCVPPLNTECNSSLLIVQ